MMNFSAKLTRWSEWGHSKIPLLFAAGCEWILTKPPDGGKAIAQFMLWILFAALYLAYGYALNDFCDREVDSRAGKSNSMSGLAPRAGKTWLGGLLCAGIISIAPFCGKPLVVAGVLLSYAFATAYSMRPFRFKERGSAGLVVSAVAQRTMPLAVGMALFDRLDSGAWLLALLFTLVGVRWILLHQVIDLPKDEAGQVSTYARARGQAESLRLMKVVVFPLEIVCLGAWISIEASALPALLLMIPVYGAWLLARVSLWHGIKPAFNWTGYWLHPMGDFYEIFWPLFLGVMLAAREPVYVLLLLFHLAWQSPYLWKQLILLQHLLQSKSRKNAV